MTQMVLLPKPPKRCGSEGQDSSGGSIGFFWFTGHGFELGQLVLTTAVEAIVSPKRGVHVAFKCFKAFISEPTGPMCCLTAVPGCRPCGCAFMPGTMDTKS